MSTTSEEVRYLWEVVERARGALLALNPTPNEARAASILDRALERRRSFTEDRIDPRVQLPHGEPGSAPMPRYYCNDCDAEVSGCESCWRCGSQRWYTVTP